MIKQMSLNYTRGLVINFPLITSVLNYRIGREKRIKISRVQRLIQFHQLNNIIEILSWWMRKHVSYE